MIIAVLHIGCGGEDDQEHPSGDPIGDCEELSAGSVEVDSEVADDVGLAGVDYALDLTHEKIDFDLRDDDDESKGTISVSGSAPVDRGPLSQVLEYESADGEELTISNEIGALPQPAGSSAPPSRAVYLSSTIESGDRSVGLFLSGELHDGPVSTIDENNPIIDADYASIAIEDGDDRDLLEAVVDGESTHSESELEQWSESRFDDRWFDDSAETIAAALFDPRIADQFQALRDACAAAERIPSGDDVRQSRDAVLHDLSDCARKANLTKSADIAEDSADFLVKTLIIPAGGGELAVEAVLGEADERSVIETIVGIHLGVAIDIISYVTRLALAPIVFAFAVGLMLGSLYLRLMADIASKGCWRERRRRERERRRESNPSALEMEGADTCPPDNENAAESVGSRQIRTVDGYTYEFRSAGEFVLVESRAADSLAVHVRQEPAGAGQCPDARNNTAIAAQMGAHRVAFYVDDGEEQLRIDGESDELTSDFVSLGDGHIVVRTDDGHYLLEWPDGTWLDVRFDGDDRLNIRFNAFYQRMGQLQGLFGRFNGYADGDIVLRNGTVLDDHSSAQIHGTYADSWRISDGESLFDYDDGESTADFTDPSVPQESMRLEDIPSDEVDAAEQSCQNAGVDTPAVLEDCIIDVYCNGEDAADDHEDREEPVDEQSDDDDPPPPEHVDDVPGSGDSCCHVDCPDGPDDDCGFVCGTGEQEEPHEWCDGDCPTSVDDCSEADPDDACTWDAIETADDGLSFGDAAHICATRCTVEVQTQCIDDDDCCPPGGQCTSLMDNDCDITPHVGSGCIEHEDCAALGDDVEDQDAVACLSEELTRIFGGVCTAGCQEDDHCPDDAHCANYALHVGGVADFSIGPSSYGDICVPSCDTDADCPRLGFGCYDANGDGRTECWHKGTVDGGEFGANCSTSRDCGEVAEGAMCIVEEPYAFGEGVWGTDATMCTRRCVSDDNCPDDWVCDVDLNICQRLVDADEIGTGCEEDADCDVATHNTTIADQCLDEDEGAPQLQGGFCSYFCSSDDDCPEGTKCPDEQELYDNTGYFSPVGFPPVCVPTCDSDDDCPRDGYGCFDATLDGETECWHIGEGDGDFGDACTFSEECGEIGEHAVCRTTGDGTGECTQFCGNDGLSCPPDRSCIAESLNAVETCVESLEDQVVGSACTEDEQCGEEPDQGLMQRDCISEAGHRMKDGYCRLTACQQDEDCPGDSHCATGSPVVDGTGDVLPFASCLKSCDTDDDCPRDGYRCYDATGDGQTECWHYGYGDTDYGESCELSADCSIGEHAICMPYADDSICSRSCYDDRDVCPDGFGCTATVNRCVYTCEEDDDCPGDDSVCMDDYIEYEDGTTEPGCFG